MNKGFTMVEMLFVILCLALLNVLYLNTYRTDKIKGFVNVEKSSQDILEAKIDSMAMLESQCIKSDTIVSAVDLCFNKRGNINQAYTMTVINAPQKIVVHLGAGVYEVK